MLTLYPGDIFLSQSQDGKLGPIIRWFQGRPGDPADFNHTGLVTRAGVLPSSNSLQHPVITEALWHVRRGSLWEFYGPPAGEKRPALAIYRPYTLDSAACTRLAGRAEEYVGRRYAWWGLGLQGADWWLTKKAGHEVYAFRHLDLGNRVYCSQLVGRVYAAEGLTFGVPEGAVPNPDDIEDYCRTHPNKYKLVFGPALLSAQTVYFYGPDRLALAV